MKLMQRLVRLSNLKSIGMTEKPDAWNVFKEYQIGG